MSKLVKRGRIKGMTESTTIRKPDYRERLDPSNFGNLIVITGASGAGKDGLIKYLTSLPDFKGLNTTNVVTCCANRAIRSGETDEAPHLPVLLEKAMVIEN